MKHLFLVPAVVLAIACCAFSQTASMRTEPVKAGAMAPDFTLKDTGGKQVTLSKLKQPAVVVFYRGYW
jgi:cytochrome oxidase Cu insertion factor (SCO1/SenC/PrrC family)